MDYKKLKNNCIKNFITAHPESSTYMDKINKLCDFPLKSSKNIIFQNPFIFGFYRHVRFFPKRDLDYTTFFELYFHFWKKSR